MRNAFRSGEAASARVAAEFASQLRREPLACFVRAALAGAVVLVAALIGSALLVR